MVGLETQASQGRAQVGVDAQEETETEVRAQVRGTRRSRCATEQRSMNVSQISYIRLI